MLALAFLSTFTGVGLSLLIAWQWFFGRRRTQDLLRMRDPSEQRATLVRQVSISEQVDQAFKQAGLSWTFRSYLVAATAGLLLAVLLIIMNLGTIAVLVMAGVSLGPWFLVRHRRRVRADQFAEQLPAALTLAANTIRSSGTLLQAVKAIAKQMPDPIAGEFARVEQALQLQVPLAGALDQARERIGAPEFAAVVVACKVAGQAGADLDVVLENISKEIVEDRQFKEAMRAASAEGRTSAKIITLLPVVGGGFFVLRDPQYFAPMVANPAGVFLLAGCVVSILVGWVMIDRITDVRTW